MGQAFPEWQEDTTPLKENAEYATPWRAVNPADATIIASVFADQAGTLHLEQSPDGEHADVDTTVEVKANEGQGASDMIVGRFWRVRYVNGPTKQTVFRLGAGTRSARE